MLARSARQPSESSSGSARLAADHHVGAREADAEARVGVALHEQAAALGAVGERLADRAVHPPAEAVRALHDRHLAAVHGLRHAVLGAALHRDVHAVDVEGAEALAADRAAVEGQRGQRAAVGRRPVLEDARARDRPGELRAEHAVVGVGRARPSRARARGRARRRRRAPRSAPTPPWPSCGSAARRSGRRPRARRRGTGRSSGSRSSISSSGRISSWRSTRSSARACTSRSERPDQVLRALEAERGRDLAHLLAHRLEEARAALRRAARTPAA